MRIAAEEQPVHIFGIEYSVREGLKGIVQDLDIAVIVSVSLRRFKLRSDHDRIIASAVSAIPKQAAGDDGIPDRPGFIPIRRITGKVNTRRAIVENAVFDEDLSAARE